MRALWGSCMGTLPYSYIISRTENIVKKEKT